MRKNFFTMLSLFFLGILFTGVISAQGIRVTGKVKDAADGSALIGVTIQEKGTTNGTITDGTGNFVLTCSPSATLIVSYVGYTAQEIAINNRSSINVTLEVADQRLQEVVVIGYGKVRKIDATGSVLAIKPDALSKGNQVTMQDALVGKIAGLQVVPSSGAPGSGATIRIRMGASLNASNSPLIVIDGVPIDNDSPEGASNTIGMLNPADIATITVLKDASATAIYGSRASNGVIIVTTKKGTEGSTKLQLSYTGNATANIRYNTLDVLTADEFHTVFNERANAPAGYTLGTDNTDWQSELYRIALGQDHNLAVTGAVTNLPYRASVGYTDQNGIVKNNNYKRWSGSVDLSPKLLDKHLSVDFNIKASYENNKGIDNGALDAAVSFDPTRPVLATYPNNVGLGYFVWMDAGKPISIAPNNPVAIVDLLKKDNIIKRSIGNANLAYKIHGLEDLSLILNLGYDVLNSTYNSITPKYSQMTYTGNRGDGTGKDYNSEQNKKNMLLDFYSNYNHTFGENHTLDVTAGYGWQHFYWDTKATTNDTEGNELSSPTHGQSEYYLLSFFGRVNYSYKHKYLLTATYRTDASSRFSPENRWGLFPSIAAAWRINEEDALKDVASISDLKLRLSYGTTGQQDIGTDYAYQPTYTASYNEARYQFGNTWYTTYRPDAYDPNLKWETTTTYNAGIDFGFFNNNLSGSIDYYKRYTKDLLMNDIPVPAGSNFAPTATTNVGSMENNGIEFAISGTPVKTNDFEWTISLNFTYNTSKITKLSYTDSKDSYVKTGDAGGTGKYLQFHKVGSTPYTWFLLKQAYDSVGNPLDGIYLDAEGNKVGTEEDTYKYNSGKSSLAPYYAGFSTRITYKSWDLGMNGHGSFGQYIFNNVAAEESNDELLSTAGVASNILRSTLKTNFDQQRRYSDYFLEKGSFFRIDNITFGYTFAELWSKSSSLRLSATVQNAWIFTGYTGLDPEIYSGIDTKVYQVPRTFMFGLNVNF